MLLRRSLPGSCYLACKLFQKGSTVNRGVVSVTTEQLRTFRGVQFEMGEGQRHALEIASVDLTKAFDTVSREAQCILQKIGCPSALLSLGRLLHDEMEAHLTFEVRCQLPLSLMVARSKTVSWRQSCCEFFLLFSNVHFVTMTKTLSLMVFSCAPAQMTDSSTLQDYMSEQKLDTC